MVSRLPFPDDYGNLEKIRVVDASMLASSRIKEKYRVERLLGHGSFSSVYLATEHLCDRRVAIKALRRDVYEGSTQYAESEIGAMARTWQHPNIVAIHTVEPGDDEYLAYIVMEYVSQGSLARRLREAPLPYEEALGIAYDICRGLAFAHRQNVIHRDIKPRNILLTESGIAKVSDFGVAQLRQEAFDYASTFAGTRRYMAPEQYEGFYDHRVDVFSVGILLWEMLTGTFPYEGETQEELRNAKMYTDPVPPSHLPSDVREVLATCLQRDASRRFRNMDVLFAEIERIVRDEYLQIVEERVSMGCSLEGLEEELCREAATLRIERSTAGALHELALTRHLQRLQVRDEEENRRLATRHAETLKALVESRNYEAARYELDRIAVVGTVPESFVEAMRLCLSGVDSSAKPVPNDPLCRAEREAKAHLDAGSVERAASIWREHASRLRQANDKRASRASRESALLFLQAARSRQAERDFPTAVRYYQLAGENAEYAGDKRLSRRSFLACAECLIEKARELERTQENTQAAETYRLAARAYERAQDNDHAHYYYEQAVVLLYRFAQKEWLDGRRDEALFHGRSALHLALHIGAWRLASELQTFLAGVREL